MRSLYRMLVAAAALLIGVPLAMAEPPAAGLLTIKQASVGLGGKFKAGFWQPIRVTLAAGRSGAKGRLEVVIPDGDQMPVIYASSERGAVDLAPGGESTHLLYAKSGPTTATIVVQLRDETGVRWSQNVSPLVGPALFSTQELVVGLGPPSALEQAVTTIRRPAERSLHAASVTAAADLPDRWWGYDGVDVLALATSDAGFLAAMSAEQQRAISDWTLLGGRLILLVGARGESIAAADSPWLGLVPGELAEVGPLRERSGLEHFTKSELPFEDELFRRQRPFVTRLKNPLGEVLVEEASSGAGRPLVIHAPVGLGEVTFVGLDLDHPALATWKGRPRLLATLLHHGRAEHNQDERGEAHQRLTHLGYDDLSGQLHVALDQFPGVGRVNFTTVSVFTLVYLLLIGPADYLLLSKFAWPRHVTWLTFPLVGLIVIGLAGFLSGRFHGARTRLNQAEIVDIDLARQRARGTAWCHLYSPTTEQYDIDLAVRAPDSVTATTPLGALAWQGLPGDALGGLESRQPALFGRTPYRVAAPGEAPGITDLTVQVAASKALRAFWEAKTSLPANTNLALDRYGLLAGEFHQPLPIPLTECLLAHGEKLYRLGTLQPGQRVALADLPPLNLEARLTERRVEQSKDVSTPWEQDSVDVPRIVQMLMFHESARGRSYTGLAHRYQARLDLSEHVRLGQAVLVGRAKEPASQLTVAGAAATPLAAADDSQYWTWYRVILPVKR